MSMDLDELSECLIVLRRSSEYVLLESLKRGEDVPETQEKLSLITVFKSLDTKEQNGFQINFSNIISLDLSHCNLSELPKQLKCVHLQDLNLSNNKLTTVPVCLYGLEALQSLELSYNQITHFDIEPNCVSNLNIIHLNNNCFENIPSWILNDRCISLVELDYSENKAKHYSFLKHICDLDSVVLKKLQLRNSCLVDNDISWLKCFKKLEFLDVSNTSLVDRRNINKLKDLDTLFSKPQWKELKILKLNHLAIAFFPEGIFWVEALTELHISNNQISWFPNGIEYLVNLELLDISFNELLILPQEICHLVKLRVLIACENKLNEIPTLPENLETLDLYNNYITNIENSNFTGIKYIDLDYNYVCLIDQDKYCSKRDQFRLLHNINDRVSEHKPLDQLSEPSWYSSECSDSDYSICEYNDCDIDIDSNMQCPLEDWDKECEAVRPSKHPDITSSDDEFNGENRLNFNNCKTQTFIYNDDDEDWIFRDAD